MGAKLNGQIDAISNISFWKYMADRLAACSETLASCHRTRLVYMAIALPVYPAVYTYVALFPESSLANHIQPSPLIPEPITWREAPETWWMLVKEFSWLTFTEPQWDYTPAVGEIVKFDEQCDLPRSQIKGTQLLKYKYIQSYY